MTFRANTAPSRTTAFLGMVLGLVLAFVGLTAVLHASILVGLLWTALASALMLFCGYHFLDSLGGVPTSAPRQPR